MLRTTRQRLDSIVEQAQRHVGYRAQPDRQSAMQLKGLLGRAWNGTFVDRVLHDALGDFAEVRFLSTVTALGYFAKRNRLYTKRVVPGDIAFFNFATDPARWDEQPHVGIIIEVRPDGSFRTVEGETSPGVPQGSQLADGVFIRERQPSELIGTVRPVVRADAASAEPSEVKMSYFDSNGKTVARAVETVQRALNRARPAWSFNRGKRDNLFKANLGVYARETGHVKNRGEITMPVLQTLGDETGLEVKP